MSRTQGPGAIHTVFWPLLIRDTVLTDTTVICCFLSIHLFKLKIKGVRLKKKVNNSAGVK